MPYSITLQPAYGRDYRGRAAILADLKADKDFLYEGRPINRPQIVDAVKPVAVNVRYARDRKIAVFKIAELVG